MSLREAWWRLQRLGMLVGSVGIAVAGAYIGSAVAQDGISVGTVSATIGQTGVVVPITASTSGNLTGLSVDVTFDPQLCGLIENEVLRAAGRTTVPVQEGGLRCPEEGRVSVVLFGVTGATLVPPGDGVIAEWVFDVRADAAVSSFPLVLDVIQARNGPLNVPLVESNGQLAILALPTATPTPTATVPPTPTTTVPPTMTAEPTPTSTPTLPEPTPTPTVASMCPGDCNGDGVVSVNELVIGVDIALDLAPLADCPPLDANDDGEAGIEDVVGAVGSALDGCPMP